jgi:uncharacterized protein YceK
MAALSDAEAAMRPARGLMIAVTAALLSGCGTVCNFAGGDPEVYGGVQKDLAFVQSPRTSPPPVGVNRGGPVFLGLVVADVFLSAVTDTLTLPLAVYLRQNERHEAGATVPTGGSDNPGGPAAGDRPGPLDWGDGESWRARRLAQPERLEAPAGGPAPSTPPQQPS